MLSSAVDRRRQEQQDRQKQQAEENLKRIRRVNEMLDRATDWFALIVPPQKERVSEEILIRLGYDAFVPIQFRWRRVNAHQKVKKYVPYIMASRYVFLGFNKKEIPWNDLHLMTEVCGVEFHGVVGIAGNPIAIPTKTMRSLFNQSGEEEIRKSAVRLNRSIVAGDSVVISDGPFKGHQVNIEGIERGKAKVIVQIFQSAQMIEVDVGDLDPA